MRKRSKYRPKGVRTDPMGYVLESITPVAAHGSVLIDLKLKNHAALATTTQGKATRPTIDVLIAALNMTEALYEMGFGDVEEHGPLVKAGMQALRSLGSRGAESGRFVMRSDEMAALNEAMELHDAQLEVITVKDMEKALMKIYEAMKHKRATPIVAKENMK